VDDEHGGDDQLLYEFHTGIDSTTRRHVRPNLDHRGVPRPAHVHQFLGIRESVWLNFICAAVEVGGLIFVIIVGAKFWGSVDYFQTPPVSAAGDSGGLTLALVMSGAVLAFFAFIGFEDMLNVAEEVKDPERTMPWGMITAIVIVTILYISVAVTAVSVVPYAELADEKKYGVPFKQITNALHRGSARGCSQPSRCSR
jgi:amino acid transporter